MDRVRSSLDAATGVRYNVFEDTLPEPTSQSVEQSIAALRKGMPGSFSHSYLTASSLGEKYDCIIALGGGSPIDTAKMAAVLHTHGGTVLDYRPPFRMDEAALPVIAVPTTAGTGSEATQFTVITDSATGEKVSCGGLGFMPAAAVVDYELTLSKPWRLSADTGIDALCHAMEAFVR